ncbi:hypothetical protein OH492_21995 [Vibrio chagasii]|nr:hypothetical protein [Vibrio chagasii]
MACRHEVRAVKERNFHQRKRSGVMIDGSYRAILNMVDMTTSTQLAENSVGFCRTSTRQPNLKSPKPSVKSTIYQIASAAEEQRKRRYQPYCTRHLKMPLTT